MIKEYKKRIITSIILFLIVILCIFIDKNIFIISILTISFFVYRELSNILLRIFGKNFIYQILGLFYLFLLFSPTSIAFYLLHGPVFFFYVLLICISSDTGGYIVGKNIGVKKLTKISPNKTILGTVGSFIFSILPLIIFEYANDDYIFSFVNLIFCLHISLICQIGDLLISYLKRKAKIKNTGKILPGHGGILDRIDGIIFVLPYAYFYESGFNNYFLIILNQ